MADQTRENDLKFAAARAETNEKFQSLEDKSKKRAKAMRETAAKHRHQDAVERLDKEDEDVKGEIEERKSMITRLEGEIEKLEKRRIRITDDRAKAQRQLQAELAEAASSPSK